MKKRTGKKKKIEYRSKCPICRKEIDHLELAFSSSISSSSSKSEISIICGRGDTVSFDKKENILKLEYANYPEPIDPGHSYREIILVCPECNHTIFFGYKNHDELSEGLKHEVGDFLSEKSDYRDSEVDI